MQQRIDMLVNAMGGGCALITKPENVRWLSGFSGEGVLVVGADRRVLITDFRYQEAAEQQSPSFTLSLTSAENPQWKRCGEALGGLNKARAELDDLTVSAYEDLKKHAQGVMFDALDALPDTLRGVKDEGEIANIRAAARITDETFTHMLSFIKPGLTEREIAAELYANQVRLGAEGIAFSSIVASGEHSSMPHAEPSMRKVRRGDLVTLDFGCVVEGYRSDFTRTIAIGAIEDEMRSVYQIVLDAQLRALDALKAGVAGKVVDAAARDYIASKGYGDMFGHGLGHGVGLAIHEKPGLTVRNDKPLEAGSVVTVEPGIYIAGKGGVRIEDLCVVTETGYINLTSSDKQLIIL